MQGDTIPGLTLKRYCNIVLLQFTSSFLNYNKNQSSLCQIRSYSLLNNNNSFITLLSLLALLNTIQTVSLSHLGVVVTSGIRNVHNHTPYTMYYSNNDWCVCASCTKALRFQSTSAASKLPAWTRLNVLPFSLQLITPLKKQCLINLENTQRIFRFSCNENL